MRFADPVPFLLGVIFLLSIGHIAGLVWSLILDRRVKKKTKLLVEELARSESIAAELARAAKEAEGAKEEAERARARAEDADRLKSRFLASVSHELRTPLHGIIGMSRLLEKEKLSPTQADFLRRIQFSASQLFRIISDLLDVSRAESGKLSLRLAPFSIAEFLDWVEPLLGEEAREKGLGFNFRFEGKKGKILADRERIAQLLFNLVSNAAKFTEVGEISVRILLRQDSLDLEVRDTGPGIGEDERVHIFDPFYQGKSELSGSGLGLGLSIVSSLVELMGGSLACDSQLGMGSRFWARLPVEELAEEAPVGGVFAASSLPPARSTAREGRRILVAEDEGLNMLYLESLLHDEGIAVRATVDGEEALAAFREGPYDLVLLDLGLPKIDGLETARLMRKHEAEMKAPRTPIIAVSARTRPEDFVDCKEAGMDSTIAKPFVESEFWAEIDRFLTPHRPRD